MLSCDSIKQCEDSLIQILDIDTEVLNAIRIDIKRYHQASNDWRLKTILGKHSINCPKSTPVCFFHFTKTLNPQSYRKGLRILPDVREQIIDEILLHYGVHSKHEIKGIIHAQLHDASKIRLLRYKEGPFGYLIKEYGNIKDSGSTSYIEGSEFVTDLLEALDYDDSIYLAKAKFVIVKFKVDNLPMCEQAKHIKEALLYVSLGHDKEELRFMNSAHDNHGVEIKPNDIIDIEIFDN